MKRIVEGDPVGILHLFGLEGESAEPFDAELSTVSPAADYILRVRKPEYLAHFEFVASYKTDSGRKMLYYDATAFFNHGLLVHGTLVLLRPEADGPAITGRVDYSVNTNGVNTYFYDVVRLWEMSPEDILLGPAALYPLAPLTNVTEADLPGVFLQMKEGIEKEPSPQELWDETKILLGLKFTAGQANAMLKGVTTNMMESTTFREIWGNAEKNVLLQLGAERFGNPTSAAQERFEKIDSLEEIDRLTKRLLKAKTWDEWFAANPSGQN